MVADFPTYYHRPRIRPWACALCASLLLSIGPAAAAPASPVAVINLSADPAAITAVAPPLDPPVLWQTWTALAVDPDRAPIRTKEEEDGAGTLWPTGRGRPAGPKEKPDGDGASPVPTKATHLSKHPRHSTATPTPTQKPTLKSAPQSRPTSTPTSTDGRRQAPDSATSGAGRSLPSPFDDDSPAGFYSGSSCPAYLNNLLNSPTFKTCYPLSMLIQTSRGLFDAAKNLVDLVRVLDAACASPSAACAGFLASAAANLTAPANCGREYALGSPVVAQAYRGLRAYQVVYSATCLQEPASAAYCYANALTNYTSPDDAYLYSLPYNISLPATAAPSCGFCTQTTLEIFRAAAADRSQLVADSYAGAAAVVDGVCGPAFVPAALPEATTSAAAGIAAARSGWLSSRLVMPLLLLLLAVAGGGD